MKVMMVISYDGSKFYGFQRQNNVRNVQGYLEKELSNILDDDIIIKGSGRTDRGVHALGQVVHFETNKSIKGLKKNLNNNLKDCYIKKIKIVNENFHARYSVKSKVYIYKIDTCGIKNNKYYLKYKYPLNINSMKEASKILVGSHNYKNFVAGERKNYDSHIWKIKIYKRKKVLYIKFKGIGFYRYMIRNLVGALLSVGSGKIDKSVIEKMIEYPEQEKRLTTVSPNGLYLVKINY